MTRAALAMLGLTAWLVVGLGSRAYLGGKAYLAKLTGSEAIADELMSKALDQPGALVLGMGPWTLLLTFGVAVSAALVLLVLWPCDRLLRRLGWARGRRVLVGAGLGAAVTGAALSSVHPLLSLPSVPEGPRTALNYACEAAGYGWVNAIVYGGALATGIALAWWGEGSPSARAPDASQSPELPEPRSERSV
jgi:hypothetical protein